MTLFTGRPQYTPVAAIVTKTDGVTTVHNFAEERLKAVANVTELQIKFDVMHRDCAKSTDLRRRQSVENHNQHTGARPVNFGVGECVLRREKKCGKKLRLTWTGPYRVIKCNSEYLFEIEVLVSHELSTSHGRRLEYFCNSNFDATDEVLHHLGVYCEERCPAKLRRAFHVLCHGNGNGLCSITSARTRGKSCPFFIRILLSSTERGLCH